MKLVQLEGLFTKNAGKVCWLDVLIFALVAFVCCSTFLCSSGVKRKKQKTNPDRRTNEANEKKNEKNAVNMATSVM